jgi:hypothetical protein
MDWRPRHLIAGAALAGILGVGGLATVASAQNDTTSTTVQDETTTTVQDDTTSPGTDTPAATDGHCADRGGDTGTSGDSGTTDTTQAPSGSSTAASV